MGLAKTVVVTAGEIIQKHAFLSIAIQRGRVNAEALRDRIGNNGKTLTKLVDEAKNQIPMAHGRASDKEARGESGFIVFSQGSIALGPIE